MFRPLFILISLLIFAISQQQANTCPQGQYWSQNNHQCQPCEPGCSICDSSRCLKYGHQHSNNRNIQIRVLQAPFPILGCDAQCQTCTGSTCTACIDGFALNGGGSGGNCQPCHSTCLTCSVPNSITNCATCVDGKYLDASDYCITCSSAFGSRCYLCTDVGCTQCQAGYFPVSGNPGCGSCPSLCISCNSTSNCVECQQYYEPIGGICTDLCGDFNVITLPCDNAKYIPFDGCDDTCQVMPDFTCTTTSNISLCSYTGPITMTQISLTRNSNKNILETSNNTLQLVVSLYPNLYAFTNTNLSKIFYLNDSQLKIQSLKYQANLLTVTIQFNRTVIGKSFQLLYRPSHTPDRRISSSQNATLSSIVQTQLPAYYYSHSVISTANALGFVSIVIVVVGWIMYFLAIPFYRLGGLELMFVLQAGWVLLAFMPDPLSLSLYKSSSLKYSSGYPIQSQILSYQTPLNLQSKHFKIDTQSLTQNLNLFLLLYILPIIFTLILRLLQCSQKYKQKSMKPKQFCIEMIMYGTMGNFIGLITYAAVFFASSLDKGNTGSIVCFLFGGSVTVVTLIWFWFDPDPFNRFRYSFKIGCLSFYHYYPYTITLVLFILLVIVLPGAPWACCIPIGILIIFTLIYRPYVTLIQNLRSSFFLLIILITAVFRCLYCLNNTQWKLSESSNSLFFIIIGILYPIAVVWAIVDIVLSFTNRKIPIQLSNNKPIQYQMFEDLKHMKELFNPQKMLFLNGSLNPLKQNPQTKTSRYEQVKQLSQMPKRQNKKLFRQSQKNSETGEIHDAGNAPKNDIIQSQKMQNMQQQEESWQIQENQLKIANKILSKQQMIEKKQAFRLASQQPTLPQFFNNTLGNETVRKIIAEQNPSQIKQEANKMGEDSEYKTNIQKYENMEQQQKLKIFNALKKQIQFVNLVNAEQMTKPKDQKLLAAYSQI